MNQLECHAYLAHQKMQSLCSARNIALTAYCPIGRGSQTNLTFNLLDNPTLKSIGTKHGKTSAQIAIRYLLQRGIVAIPKSVQRTRLEENFNVFDFELGTDDMSELLGLDSNQRLVWYPDTKESRYYPFNIEF